MFSSSIFLAAYNTHFILRSIYLLNYNEEKHLLSEKYLRRIPLRNERKHGFFSDDTGHSCRRYSKSLLTVFSFDMPDDDVEFHLCRNAFETKVYIFYA